MPKRDDAVLGVPPDMQDVAAALNEKTRLELHALLDVRFAALASELKHDIALAMQSLALRFQAEKPDVNAALLAAYPYQIPRIVHKKNVVVMPGDAPWFELRVDTIAECDAALADGWTIEKK